MAFISQDKKKSIAAALKFIIPKSWKYSLSVNHHSTLVLTIQRADVDFLGAMYQTGVKEWEYHGKNPHHKPADKPNTYGSINRYHWVIGFGADPYALKYNTNPALSLKDTSKIHWGPLGEKEIRRFGLIMDTLNAGNHDNSDLMTDYHDVGWYIEVKFGKYEKPFEYIPPLHGSDGDANEAITVETFIKNISGGATIQPPATKVVKFGQGTLTMGNGKPMKVKDLELTITDPPKMHPKKLGGDGGAGLDVLSMVSTIVGSGLGDYHAWGLSSIFDVAVDEPSKELSPHDLAVRALANRKKASG